MKKLLLTTAIVLATSGIASANQNSLDEGLGAISPLFLVEDKNGNPQVSNWFGGSYQNPGECFQNTCSSWKGVVYQTQQEAVEVALADIESGNYTSQDIIDNKYVDWEVISPLIDAYEQTNDSYYETVTQAVDAETATGQVLIAVPGNYVGETLEEDGTTNYYGGITYFAEVSIATNDFSGTKYEYMGVLYDTPGEAAVAQINTIGTDEDYANSPLWTDLPEGVTPEAFVKQQGLDYFVDNYYSTVGGTPVAEYVDNKQYNPSMDAVVAVNNIVKTPEVVVPTLTEAQKFQAIVNEYVASGINDRTGATVELAKDVFEKGYNGGFEDGYNQGYQDGYADGYADGWNARDAQG